MTNFEYGYYHDDYQCFSATDSREEAESICAKYRYKGCSEVTVYVVRRPVGDWERVNEKD